ncbi:DNA-dependent metalloprotease WSS1-like protein [Cladobotryum mycophilum]|uniref:DNA-dependent metalloprotease WSS1-like protein n=1 Tax=Cladobotryum mycophilum TaxID=491253 RepID=A0ABR0SFM8_9HYPO
MPIGIQRLNTKKSQPNPCIIFIKALKGPDEAIAQDFLERIAAQCLPVMREHHIDVMALEEFPANREFVGRNFNAGEVVQLVLKSLGGRWLPFNYVQMVMMHELAHCKQMNHSKAFWAVRNQYASQMQGLWSKGYTGDGLWGRGATLGTGEWDKNTVHADEILPEHLCGGTYRSQKTKRKVKPVVTYQERKERRILKKFGANGMALGADEDAKIKLEKGKRIQSKPRVAGSARGRELRAAAALARFEKNTDTKDGVKKEETETDSDSSDYEIIDLEEPAIDLDGTRLVDKDGKGLVKICEDENTEDSGAKDELNELRGIFGRTRIKQESPEVSILGSSQKGSSRRQVKREEQTSSIKSEAIHRPKLPDIPQLKSAVSKRSLKSDVGTPDGPSAPRASKATAAKQPPAHIDLCDVDSTTKSCSMCSFANLIPAITCAVCSNVLHPSKMPNAWRCSGASCENTTYMNSGDCGVCGLCGQRRA